VAGPSDDVTPEAPSGAASQAPSGTAPQVPSGAAPEGRFAAAWQLLVGQPLRRSQAATEQITPLEGLAALSLDALTSVAYGPEAIIVVLAVAGAGALHLIFPITIVILVLLAILVTSYRQVIDAYPRGGGAYAVSRANLGARASLVAAGSLVVDYTLTVAVSVSAGVGALTSAFPRLDGATVPLCLAILAVIALLNLRGVGNAARAFLLPTLLFIVGLLAIIAVGLIHPLAVHAPQPGVPLTATTDLQAVTVLLMLKAFSAGCSALTGVEAIANGVPLFKPPRQKRAKRTEMLLGTILGVMLLGLSVLASHWHIGPRSGQTVLSQIMADAVGRHWAYYVVSISITVVLALAANTSFGGLPILGSLLARDNYLPHLFALRGERQVFDFGILTLTVFSAGLLIAVGGNTDRLIPLFAIGVFTGFTLSQSGMVVHWWRRRPRGWRRRAAINGLGAAVTAVATVVFVLTKFVEGGWVVVVAVPTFILLFVRIHRYYQRVARLLSFNRLPPKPEGRRTRVIVPFTNISRVLERALSEALSIGEEAVAVTVVGDDEDGNREADKIQRHWERWNPGVELQVLRTDYASLVQPVVSLIDELRSGTEDQIVVLIPVIVPDALRHRLLHNHVDFVLRRALRSRTDIVVARVPMGLDEARRSSRSRFSRPRSRSAAR